MSHSRFEAIVIEYFLKQSAVLFGLSTRGKVVGLILTGFCFLRGGRIGMDGIGSSTAELCRITLQLVRQFRGVFLPRNAL